METVDCILKIVEKSEQNNKTNTRGIVTNNFSTSLLLQTCQECDNWEPNPRATSKTRCALFPSQLWPEHTSPKPEPRLHPLPLQATKLPLNQIQDSGQDVLLEWKTWVQSVTQLVDCLSSMQEARGSIQHSIKWEWRCPPALPALGSRKTRNSRSSLAIQ